MVSKHLANCKCNSRKTHYLLRLSSGQEEEAEVEKEWRQEGRYQIKIARKVAGGEKK